jgi:hypothetical protein
MAYLIDDGFDTWPETARAGTAAAGLYLRCGVWIARNIWIGTIGEPVVTGEIAAMYGTPEWARRLCDAGLWGAEEPGYRDLHYHRMGNLPADKVAAKRKAEADRKARWRESQRSPTPSHRDTHGTRRGTPTGQDAGRTVGKTSTSPPLKGEGGAAPATQAHAAPPPPNPRTTRCHLHQGQPAHNCGICRSEAIAP